MTEYEYQSETFDFGETVDIPDSAIGVSTSTWGAREDGYAFVTVKYLVPTSDSDE